MPETELYDRLGGRDGIRAVVDDFYDRLLADDELGPFFADADTVVQAVAAYEEELLATPHEE